MTCTGSCNGNPCDGVDHCDGNGNCIDVYLPSSTVCRKAASGCDIAETCTGESGQCPMDKFEPTTTKCSGTCNDNPCDAQDYCDGNGSCVDKYLPSGAVCGNTKAGPCTIAATCTGDMGFCPPDEYADSSVTCAGTSQGGACDGKDTCDGEGNCVDRFLGGKVVCQKPTGYSRPIYCNGKSATCPVSSFLEGNLREMTADDPTPVQSMLVAVAPSSPMVLLGLVCVVAAAVAMVTMRQRRDELALDDATYKLLATHEDASAAF
ncbi:hypothetical protein SDRG_14115 [Saprolegnia diclina VS20]|uniref:Disintegrin domain-containing protein n=2 Tax=Saprolegnia diclina (strain VS20) TaxID=1156394 RepID=T0R7T5_SAPDV|nr:hypothetical protein SDRG_14115 [Saprolegnia diclina VS20]EQC28158.1 hypothetical protein SDRG_14115 [Saprolegnia diclina VS20]|eukprot:XP_008618444.1 hypothetical protein SDRG_14115 [Saprolegnia diclina VS20]